ncbi:MAG: galactose-1-phosphate uridylyltransferase [bacterium]|nr:galactose-1-phosphate uridylyltransferase [bacterium]MDT8395024.1 galactose-1-phosphate uridylyltransferase [bacterium]
MSELRYDPIRKTWVIIATERGMRPTHIHRHEKPGKPAPKGVCPFCPGNEDRTPPEIMAIRDQGTAPNSEGWRVRVIPNKFPALTIESSQERYGKGIYDVVSGFGAHEVIVETPNDDEQMVDFSIAHLRDVFSVYRDRLSDLRRDSRFRYVLIFKNYGSEAGASLCHSHSQIIAIPVTPSLVAVELASARDYYQRKERCMMCDIIHQELEDGDRIVINEELFVAFTPFASSFPFELRIAPKRHNHDFSTIDEDHLQHFASVVKELLARLSRVLNDPPYNFILHTSPPEAYRAGKPEYWTSISSDYHWYLELVPRMTMIAGFEWGTGFQINPTSPEDAARFLREAEI